MLTSAEVVDLPRSNSSRGIDDDLTHPRAFPVAVRMAEQRRVLICGGHDGLDMLQSCEFFDEQTETFELAEDLQLTVPASAVEAVALDDGTFLLVGGTARDGQPAANGLIYFP